MIMFIYIYIYEYAQCQRINNERNRTNKRKCHVLLSLRLGMHLGGAYNKYYRTFKSLYAYMLLLAAFAILAKKCIFGVVTTKAVNNNNTKHFRQYKRLYDFFFFFFLTHCWRVFFILNARVLFENKSCSQTQLQSYTYTNVY